MRYILVAVTVVALCGCSHVTDGKVRAELGFGSVLGKWLPRLAVEVEFKQENRSDL